MKSCPKCNRTFPDEGQKFCTFDGGLLIAPQTFDPNATMRATSIDLNAASDAVVAFLNKKDGDGCKGKITPATTVPAGATTTTGG